jgi:uncharacterized membrane protein YccC
MAGLRLAWPLSPAWSYALHNTVAALVALYVAFYLQLDTPYSAATTVFILASPLHGMVLSKGLYRALGTVAGALASLALVAWFAQTPVLFMIGFSLWLGLCTAVATLLRYFRSYAAVLAGYTVSLIAFGAIEHPDQIFDLAMARMAVVMVGVVVSSLMTVLIIPGGENGKRRLQSQMRKVAHDMADFMTEALRGGEITALQVKRRRAIVAAINALDPLIEAAGSESVATARHVPALRALAARFYEVLIILTAIQESLAAMTGPAHDALRALTQAAADLSARRRSLTAAEFQAEIETLSATIQAYPHDFTVEVGQSGLAALVLLDRLLELLDRLPRLLGAIEAVSTRPLDVATGTLLFHTDGRQALVNGVRAAAAVMLAYVFWYETAWSSGGLMFGALAPVTALLATADNPEQGSIAFVKGIAIGAVIAFLYTFFVMPQISGFPLLALSLAPIFLIGSYLTTKPKHALVATAFLIFGNTFIGVRNPMTYDVLSFLNSATAILVGTVFSTLAFRLILPVDPRRFLNRLRDAMGADLEALATAGAADFVRVQHRMHDRAVRLLALSGIEPTEHEAVLAGSRAAMRIGYEIGRIHDIMDALTAPEAIAGEIQRAATALRHIRHDPHAAAETLAEAAARLTTQMTTLPEAHLPVARVAGAFHEISFLIDRYDGFFKPRRKAGGFSPVAFAG